MSHLSTYIGIFLDQNSKGLLNKLRTFVPKDWVWYGDHMTIKFFGAPTYPEDFPEPYDDLATAGRQVSLVVTHIGLSDDAIAVKVNGYPVDGLSHITLATPMGGSPKQSKNITHWKKIKSFTLHGTIMGNGDAGEFIFEDTTLYHGGHDIGDELILKLGHKNGKYTGYDSGALFFTPTVSYAQRYMRHPSGLYKFILKDESKIFDVTNQKHIQQLQKGFTKNWKQDYSSIDNALNDYKHTVQSLLSTAKHGAADWGTASQFVEQMEKAGFEGVKMLERSAEFIDVAHDDSYTETGNPVYSYAIFRNNIKVERAQLEEVDEPSETVIPMGDRWNDQLDGGDYNMQVWAAPTQHVKYGGNMTENTIKKLVLKELGYSDVKPLLKGHHRAWVDPNDKYIDLTGQGEHIDYLDTLYPDEPDETKKFHDAFKAGYVRLTYGTMSVNSVNIPMLSVEGYNKPRIISIIKAYAPYLKTIRSVVFADINGGQYLQFFLPQDAYKLETFLETGQYETRQWDFTEQIMQKLILKEMASSFPFNVGSVENTYDSWTDRPGDRNINEIEYTDITNLPFASAVERAGGKIYQVGGAVRDSFLGKQSKDLDIMVSGITPEKLMHALSPFGRANLVGQSFGVIKFKPHGATEDIDIALARTDQKTGEGHKGISVSTDPSISVEKDLERRDFTINAIAKDMHGNLIDPFGGQQDLKNGIIRMVSPIAFAEDPLRMLRAIQFAARFNFTVEPHTFDIIKQNASTIRTISGERLLEEFNKMITKGNPSVAAQLLVDSGLYEAIFGVKAPQLYDLNKVKRMSEFVFLLLRDSGLQPSAIYKNKLKGDIDNFKEIKAFELTKAEIKTPAEERWLLNKVHSIAPNATGSFVVQDKIKDISKHPEDKYPRIAPKIAISSDEIQALGIKNEFYGKLNRDLLDLIYKDELPNEHYALLNYVHQNIDKYKPNTPQKIKEIATGILEKSKQGVLNPNIYLFDKRYAEMVSVAELDKFKEFDRAGSEAEHWNTANVQKLLNEIRVNGIDEALMLAYYQAERKAMLIEGNHRLAVAKMLGIKELPVIVTRYERRDASEKAVKVTGVEPNEHGYVRGTLSPTEIGIPARPIQPSDYMPAPPPKPELSTPQKIQEIATKLLHQMSARSKEYADMNVDDIDRQAFGFASSDIKTIDPKKLHVKYKSDFENVLHAQQISGLGKLGWARTINLTEPVQLSYEKGKFWIEDGHHRYYAALILGKMLNVDDVEIKDKPHLAAVKKAIAAGQDVPAEVLQDYPELKSKSIQEIEAKLINQSDGVEEYENFTLKYVPNADGYDLGHKYGGDMIYAYDKQGKEIGDLFYGKDYPTAFNIKGAVHVQPEYRRQGIGSAMYRMAERISGIKMTPDHPHSANAEAFWDNPNRDFGYDKESLNEAAEVVNGYRISRSPIGDRMLIRVASPKTNDIMVVPDTGQSNEELIQAMENKFSPAVTHGGFDKLVEEFKRRIPALKNYNQFVDEHSAKFQLIKNYGKTKVYWNEETVMLKDVAVHSELNMSYRNFNDYKWYYFTFTNKIYPDIPEDYGDVLTRRIFQVATNMMNDKFAYSKELRIRELEDYQQADIDQIVNEINRKTFEFEDYLTQHYVQDNLFEQHIHEEPYQHFDHSDALKFEKALMKAYQPAYDVRAAAYITPNGYLTSLVQHDGISREDHRAIVSVMQDLGIDMGKYNDKEWARSDSKWMYAALDMGFIRNVPEAGAHMEMRVRPTGAQFARIREMCDAYHGHVTIDMIDTEHHAIEFEYETQTDWIEEEIRRFFTYGEMPRQMTYDDEDLMEQKITKVTKQQLQEMVMKEAYTTIAPRRKLDSLLDTDNLLLIVRANAYYMVVTNNTNSNTNVDLSYTETVMAAAIGNITLKPKQKSGLIPIEGKNALFLIKDGAEYEIREDQVDKRKIVIVYDSIEDKAKLTENTVKKLTYKLLMESKRNQLRRLAVYDMDSTLVGSPMPDYGRAEWKEKTGTDFPNAKAWWSVPESLDTKVFDIKAIPPVFNQMRDDQRRPDTMVVVMTNRLDSLEREVRRVLKVNRINPDMLSMAEYSMQNKGERILQILKGNPTIKYVAFYDDQETNLQAVRRALKGKGITYDLYNCQDGKIRRT